MGSDGIDVLLAGQTGVGKSSVANMILGTPDGSPGAANVSGDARPCTTETTSYDVQLDGVRCKLWDTRGLDEAVDSPKFIPKLLERFRQPDRDLKTTCRKRIKEATPILIWCILASKIDVPVHWEQFRKVCVEYCDNKVKPVVVITKMTPAFGRDWESRCKAKLREFGVEGTDYFLFQVREYRKLTSPEYKQDSADCQALISRIARQLANNSSG